MSARRGASRALSPVRVGWRKRGVTAHLRALGVSAGGPKAEALAGLCEAVFPTVNEAIAYIAELI